MARKLEVRKFARRSIFLEVPAASNSDTPPLRRTSTLHVDSFDRGKMIEILERQRNAHEDIERMEQAIVDRMAEDPRTRYDALAMEHEVADFLVNIQRQADFLVETYRDENAYYP
jgi:hypothetical protein